MKLLDACTLAVRPCNITQTCRIHLVGKPYLPPFISFLGRVTMYDSTSDCYSIQLGIARAGKQVTVHSTFNKAMKEGCRAAQKYIQDFDLSELAFKEGFNKATALAAQHDYDDND